jgi:thiamine pyrophosphokinase
MRAIIFANGEFRDPFRSPNIQDGDLVIAADGGSRHCQVLKITPDLLIGDLDSTDPILAASWEKAGVEVIRHPVDKDQTDLELALLLAQERGAEEAWVYGAVGGRLDMTFGNLVLLAHPLLEIPTTLICEAEEVHLLRPGDSLTLAGSPGDTLSLLALHPDGAGVTAQGVQYVLENEKLEFGLTRGISNQLTHTTASIRLETGLLAVIHTRRSS